MESLSAEECIKESVAKIRNAKRAEGVRGGIAILTGDEDDINEALGLRTGVKTTGTAFYRRGKFIGDEIAKDLAPWLIDRLITSES